MNILSLGAGTVGAKVREGETLANGSTREIDSGRLSEDEDFGAEFERWCSGLGQLEKG
jgi:hypothetical protein